MDNEIFGEDMKVRDAISMLEYGTEFEIQGFYSGKIYHRSWVNKKEHVEKFFDETTTTSPFYTKIRVNKTNGISEWARPVIGIWMHDYNLCKH